LLSAHGVPVEEIARLVGDSSTTMTELVYRKQIRPVIQTGAIVLDAVFGSDRDSHADRHAAVVEPDVSGEGHVLTGTLMVGDTGIEPVTSSVSIQNLRSIRGLARGFSSASVQVRGGFWIPPRFAEFRGRPAKVLTDF
jgi:hypothetical protein